MALKYNILIYYMAGRFTEEQISQDNELITNLIKDDGSKAIDEGDSVYLQDLRIGIGGPNKYFWKGKVIYLDLAKKKYSIKYEDQFIENKAKMSFTQNDIDPTDKTKKVTIYKIPAQNAAQSPAPVVGGRSKRRTRRKKRTRRQRKAKKSSRNV